MKILVTFATVAVAGSAIVGAPFAASAQTHRETIYDFRGSDAAPVYNVSDIDRPAYSGLPPNEVLTIVRSMGFDPQSRPIRRGGVYVVRAFDDQDIPVRVIVDARSGRVVNVAERGPMQDDEGPIVEERYSSAYPVPPRAVPGGEVYRETDDRGSDYRGPDYGRPDYRAPNYRAPDYRSSDGRVYTPAPYAPSAKTQSSAPHPRVAVRTPAKVTPTPPKRPATAAVNAAPAAKAPATPPKTQAAVTPAATPATATPATATPKGSATQAAAPPAANAAVAQDASHHGTSIPAPVASRKAETPAAQSPAAKPDIPAKSADPSLVPVAPLD